MEIEHFHSLTFRNVQKCNIKLSGLLITAMINFPNYWVFPYIDNYSFDANDRAVYVNSDNKMRIEL